MFMLAFPLLLTVTAALLDKAPSASAGEVVEVVLERVTEFDGRQQLRLVVESRGEFFFDTGTQTLTSAGIWTAQQALGPSRLTRYTHRVEGLTVGADDAFDMRSYECIEGTLGATALNANVCGNYGFGPNFVDDGGYGDDVPRGPPKSLYDYRLEALEWDGERLRVVLARPPLVVDDPPVGRLELEFTRAAK
ncbi:MAG: hypothetical protein L6Q83_09040 [Gammaproteobacteria bacterium]|nr:hypothetical protein [Gammaproteobacteria bacterium]